MMLKERIRQYLPNPKSIKKSPSLRWLGGLLHDTRLWQFNRRSIANGFALGLFAMWIPLPSQMLFVAALAIFCRANLPLSIALVWITNPITIPPMFFGAYALGTWLLNHDPQIVDFDISIEWLTHSLGQIWEPFLLGCFILGVTSAALGYLLVQLAWRIYIHRALEKRKLRRNGGKPAPL